MNYHRTYTYLLSILVCSCLSTTLLCQSVSIDAKAIKFDTFDDATKVDDYCYQLTANKERAGGSLWYPEAINLKENFYIDMNLFFGCDDSLGADGMVLMFCKKKVMGGKGAGMGYLKLTPSLGIEFDTYQNATFGDPKEDHIAVLENGNIKHQNQDNKPIIRVKNIEDCDYHSVILEWNASQSILTLKLDGKEIIKYRKDIVQKIFKGQSSVYWGISAATGSDHNSHKVCFNTIEMEPAEVIHQFTKMIEVLLKRGTFIALDQISFEKSDLAADNATNVEVKKILNFLENNKDKHLDIFAHVHNSGNDQDLSIKRAIALKEYLVSKGIKEDRLKAKGLGNKYLRSNRDIRKGLSNTRIEIYLFEPLP